MDDLREKLRLMLGSERAGYVFAAIEASGHKIVPVEPTEEMVMAGINDVGWTDDDDDKSDLASAYRAMLSAAQGDE